MQTIFLVRHGETDWNAEKRMQGQIQHIMLNEEGLRQSRLLAKRLANERIDIIYSSPQERALQTAEMIAKPHSLSIITHAGLAERTHGLIDGMSMDEFKKKYPKVFDEYMKTREIKGMEGAETLAQLTNRAMAAFKEIVEQNLKKNILIVSHGGICKNIIMALAGMPSGPSDFAGAKDGFKRPSLRQHNCCINIIKSDGKRFVVEKIDDTSHLEMEID